MSQELFADRIGDITVANGMVRIEFLSLKTQDSETQEIEFTVSHMVVPLTSFKEIVGRPGYWIADRAVRKDRNRSSDTESSSIIPGPDPLCPPVCLLDSSRVFRRVPFSEGIQRRR